MTTKQTRKTDAPTLRLMAAGALVVASACAAPILATETLSEGQSEAAPVSCGVATESHGAMTTFRPWVRLDPPQSGDFRFALRGGGTVVDQGGYLEPGAAGQAVLGEATVTGRAADYDVELTVQVGGTTYHCHVDGQEI